MGSVQKVLRLSSRDATATFTLHGGEMEGSLFQETGVFKYVDITLNRK
jgi:hypothetical protein